VEHALDGIWSGYRGGHGGGLGRRCYRVVGTIAVLLFFSWVADRLEGCEYRSYANIAANFEVGNSRDKRLRQKAKVSGIVNAVSCYCPEIKECRVYVVN